MLDILFNFAQRFTFRYIYSIEKTLNMSGLPLSLRVRRSLGEDVSDLQNEVKQIVSKGLERDHRKL